MPRRNKNKNIESYSLDVQAIEHQLRMEDKKALLQQTVEKLKEAQELKEAKKEEELKIAEKTEATVAPAEEPAKQQQEEEKAIVVKEVSSSIPVQDYTKIDVHCDYLNKAEEILKEVNNLFNSLELDFDYVNSIINVCQDEQNDLLHEIELSPNLSPERVEFLYRELQNCRIKRRNYKDLKEKVTPINDFYKKNKAILQMLTSTYKEMVKVRRNKRNPVYVPRVRTDLTI